jgi:hypothetical protein
MKQGGHDDFMWFMPPEHNTLCQRDEFVQLCVFLNLALNWPGETWLKSLVTRSLYSTGSGSYMQPQGPTGGPGVVNDLL